MSVIGIDFGNESCFVAAARSGGIETLSNDYSLRATPSCVAFDGRKRIIGVAAKNQQVTNMKNTVTNIKRLLGRKFDDPYVKSELKNIPTQVEATPDGGIGFKVNYLDSEQLFTPEQLTAMLFTKLKDTSANALQAQVNDCVITCPVYFTNAERQALLDAAQIAGLNVLRLMNETTATALSYGFYKNDLTEDKTRNVIFVDCGHASLQVSVCAFTKGKLKMLASSWDQIGGRDFDNILAEHFAKEFMERYKINAKNNSRSWLRLLAEVEKLKKQMSANSTKLPLNIECFMNDIDISSSMQRSKMEELCAPLLQRVEATFKKLLTESKLPLEDIHSVEIVGGSTRVPAIKQLIEQVFGKPASTTLNQDEAVSRGAALQCAIMSPAIRVREFGVTDIQNYAVRVCWDAVGSTNSGHIEVFPAFHSAPFSRLLTLNRKDAFRLILQYAQPIPYPSPVIGHWYIKDVRPNERGEFSEVKVKVRINHHGIVLISSASLVERKELDDVSSSSSNITLNGNQKGSDTSIDVHQSGTKTATNDSLGNQQNIEDQNNCSMEFEGDQGESVSVEINNECREEDNITNDPSAQGGSGWTQRVKGWFCSTSGNEKKRKVSKMIDLPMEYKTHGCTPAELSNLINQENKMVANDAKETERIDAKNALEEYVYDMRNKLQGGCLESYVAKIENTSICNQLNDVENWLYEDGMECDCDTYINKLQDLKVITNPIKARFEDFERCPIGFKELKQAIAYGRTAVNDFKHGLPKYEHLTEIEFLNIAENCDRAQTWYDTNFSKFNQTPRTVDSPVKAHEIYTEIQNLTSSVNNVINRPKPKPPTTKTPNNKDFNAMGDDQHQNGVNNDGKFDASNQGNPNVNMETE